MSVAAHRYVSGLLDDPACPLDSTARHVLRELADFANDAGDAWPSLATIARRVGRSRSTVWRARERIVARTELVYVPGAGGGRRATALYHFPLSTPVAPTRRVAPSTRRAHATDPSRPRDIPVAPDATRIGFEPVNEPRAPAVIAAQAAATQMAIAGIWQMLADRGAAIPAHIPIDERGIVDASRLPP